MRTGDFVVQLYYAEVTFIIRIAFRALAPLRATANLSWRGLYLHFRAEKLQCHMTRGWRTAIHWT